MWGFETTESRVDEKSAKVAFKDGVLSLSHDTRYVSSTSKYQLACLFPVILTYHVRGLPKGKYIFLDTRRLTPVRLEIDG